MDRALTYTTPVVALAFLAFFALERRFPLRARTRKSAGRLVVNAVVTTLALIAAALLVRPAMDAALASGRVRPFGLLYLVDLPSWLRVVLAILLMDLAFYYWHRLNHAVPFLWRFHNVHHADPDLDVSTGFRFHFGEVALSAAFRVVQVGAIGVSVWAFALFEILFQVSTLFHHSNLRLPVGLERALNRVLVTPRMHGIHHSRVRGETNSNYSVVFRWWDALHRTLVLGVPQSQIEIGVAGYSRPDDNSIRNLIAMPFRKQRDHWRDDDGALPQRASAAVESQPGRIQA